MDFRNQNRNRSSYLPSKRIGLLVGVVIIGFGVYGLIQAGVFSGVFGSDTPTKQEVAQTLKQTDSDNDGLSDWRENLWNTDPQIKDTDGDGVIDGKEVKQNRDPTKAGNDTLSAIQREDIENGARQGVDTNQTKQIFRQILPSAIVLANNRQSGTSSKISTKQINKIVKETQENLTVNTEEDRPYTRDNITVVESTPDTRKTYSQYLTANLSTIAEEQPGDELLLFAQAAKGQSPEKKYQQMRDISQLYTDMNQDLLSANVPKDFADQHTQLVNNYHVLALSIGEMTRVDDDPARALAAIQRYRKIVRDNADLLYRIGQKLNQDLDY